MKRILFSVLTLELLVIGAVRVLCASEPQTDKTVSVASVEPAAIGFETVGALAAAEEPRGRAGRVIKKVPRLVTVYEDVVDSDADSALRRKYAEVMAERARRLSDEDLKSAIEQFEMEMKEQDAAADAEVRKALAILEAVVETSQGTPAAARSKMAITVLKGELPRPGEIPPGNTAMDSY